FENFHCNCLEFLLNVTRYSIELNNYLPIDTFSTLSKLRIINLNWNKIKEIPNGVFSNNLQLEVIYLKKILGSTLFDGLTKLSYVQLRENVCIIVTEEVIYVFYSQIFIAILIICSINEYVGAPLFNFCFVLVVLCGVFEMSHGTDLNCDFYKWNYYACYVTSLDNTNNNMVITGYSGTPDKNVQAISIENTNTKYIPKDLGLLFNLTALSIESSQLVEIKAEDFSNMKNLVNLVLFNNLLEEIPNGVFAKNLQLKYIELRINKIKFIGSSVFDGLTKLNYVNLWNNICIDYEYEESTGIIELKNDLKIKYLDGNKLTSIPIDTFSTLTKLKIIELSSNLIKEFPNGVFSNNLQLEFIYLSYNKIKFLGSTLFDGLTQLDYVDLQKTQLIEIKTKDFIGMRNLEELNLSQNKLTSVPIGVFSTLTRLKSLNLGENEVEEIPNG
ncbi:unnamed protein product, partial [Diamesa serratosioi]